MLFDEDIEIIIESDVFVNASGVNEFSKIDLVEVDTNEDIIIIQVSDSIAPVQSVNGKIGFVNIDKTDIGLSNVENISILNTSGYLDNKITNLSNDVVYTTGYQELSGYKYFLEGFDSNYIAVYPAEGTNASVISFYNKFGSYVDLYVDDAPNFFYDVKLPTNNGTLLTDQSTNVLFTSGVQIISGLKIVSGQYPPSDEYSIDDIRESGAYFFIDDAERFQYYIIAPASQNNYVKFGPYSLGKLHKDTEDLFFTTNGLVNTTNSLSNEISGVSGYLQNQIDNLDLDYASDAELSQTGSALQSQINNLYFTGDLTVSLANNKTFGRYINGEVIPASGKTPSEIIQMALVEPILPTLSLTSSTTIIFNQTGINNILNANNTINSLNASVQTGYIEWRRGGIGSWTQLTGNSLNSFSFTHSIVDSNFNTSGFNYRYVVIDTVGATNTGTLNINPTSYIAPTVSFISIGSSTADLGNTSTTIAGTINRNSPNVNLVNYQLQYQSIIGGATSAWTNIGSITSIPGSPHVFSVAYSDVSLVNATSISYRILVTDEYQTTTLTLGTRSFLYRNYLGYNPNTSLTLSEIESLVSSTLSNSKSRTIANVTAGAGNYTYYCYRAGAGDLTSIIQDGAAPVLGAFTKLSDVNGLNIYGANVTYRVYRSNATNAFTNNTLSFN